MPEPTAPVLVIWKGECDQPLLELLADEMATGVVQVGGQLHVDDTPTKIFDGGFDLEVLEPQGWWKRRSKWRRARFATSERDIANLLRANSHPDTWRVEEGLLEEAHGITNDGIPWVISHDVGLLYVSTLNRSLYQRVLELGGTEVQSLKVDWVTLTP